VQRPRTGPLPAPSRRLATSLLRRLAGLWQRPGLRRMQVMVHPGLRRTLGRYSRRTRHIELSSAVLTGATLTDVLTHEAAHAALATAKATPVRPHGPEWRQLMALAGSPDAKATRWCRNQEPGATQPDPKPGPSAPKTYDHWCPVCQASRPAKKPVRAWRCAACVAAGLPGHLEITPRARKRQQPQAPKPPRQNPQP
jgi:predicted SprT family Zn-dependent metalloprotease